jgi:menaquinone-dependent protoporphyrinogen oxidase
VVLQKRAVPGKGTLGIGSFACWYKVLRLACGILDGLIVEPHHQSYFIRLVTATALSCYISFGKLLRHQKYSKLSKMKILILYATTFGSTRSIAERISLRLSAAAIGSTTLQSIEEPVENLSDFDALVIGSCIHGFNWVVPPMKFIQSNAELLNREQKLVWAFSVGTPLAIPLWFCGCGQAARAEGGNMEKKLKEHVKLRGHKLFGGEWKSKHIPPVFRQVWTCCGVKWGDYRNWEEIDEWTDEIINELRTVPTA